MSKIERQVGLQAMAYNIIQATSSIVSAIIERDSPSFDSAEALKELVIIQQEYVRRHK